jgi:O-acetyl-ADP-ribose deacetylase (regulator of RNase III)
VEGEVERGYRGNQDAIDDAVRHTFERFGELAENEPLTSILFPLFGAGVGRVAESLVATRVVRAVDKELKTKKRVQTVYLMAYVESHRLALHRAAADAGWTEVARGSTAGTA